jgi:hypothetical protein
VATGQELFSLEGHRGAVVAIAFSADGRTLATAARRDDRLEAEYCFWSAGADAPAWTKEEAGRQYDAAHAK